MNIEFRQISGLEVRAEERDGTQLLAGRGIPHNEWSEDLGGFRERIAPGAFREAIADGDIRVLYNHNPDIVLGRQSTGTARIEEREDGVHYEVVINEEDADAKSAAARIRRGDVSGNSFGFFVERAEDQTWEERDGMMWRTIHRAQLRELGPQTFPAYPTSDVSVRSVDAVLEEGRKWLEQKRTHGNPDVLRRRMDLE